MAQLFQIKNKLQKRAANPKKQIYRKRNHHLF